MPSYDFVCNGCGHKFAVFCDMNARKSQTCPQCASTDLRQRFTKVNVCGVSGGSGGSGGCSSCSAGQCKPGCKG